MVLNYPMHLSLWRYLLSWNIDSNIGRRQLSTSHGKELDPYFGLTVSFEATQSGFSVKSTLTLDINRNLFIHYHRASLSVLDVRYHGGWLTTWTRIGHHMNVWRQCSSFGRDILEWFMCNELIIYVNRTEGRLR